MKTSRHSTVIEDYDAVLEIPDKDGLPRIILGGQAVNIWANHYFHIEKNLSEYLPFTSKDLDIFGVDQDVYELAQRTGFKMERVKKGTPTPAVGVLFMPGKDLEPIKIEVLNGLYGINASVIKKRAVLLEYKDKRKFRVLDPITILEAKIQNAVYLSQDKPGRERQDVKHMKMMIYCVRGFLRDQIREVDKGGLASRDCIDSHEQALKVISSKAAIKASRLYAVHWIETMPLKELQKSDEPKLKNFVEKRLSRWIQRIKIVK